MGLTIAQLSARLRCAECGGAAALGQAVANGRRVRQAAGAKRVNGRPYRSCYCPQIQEPRILKGSIRLLISVAFALAVATSAEAMSPKSLHEPDAMITQITDKPCNLPGQVQINGICMLRSTTMSADRKSNPAKPTNRAPPPTLSPNRQSTNPAKWTNRATFPVRYKSMVSACCALPPSLSVNATIAGVRNGTKVYALSTTETQPR